MNDSYDVGIIGSGCAGLSAAIYASRENYETLVIRGEEPGGQLTLTSEIANYPGFSDGISGPELIQEMEDQAAKFGTEFENGIVQSIEKRDGRFVASLKNGERRVLDSVIIASGSRARTLDIPGEDELMGYGVSTCATCDGAFYRGDDVAIVGGGDAAAEEAVFLTKFADTVHLIHRRNELRAESYLANKVKEKEDNEEINILWNTEVTEVEGSKDTGVHQIQLVSHPAGHPTRKESEEVENIVLDVDGVFLAIGHTPNTDFLETLSVSIENDGYIETATHETYETMTDTEGIFVAGDVADKRYQQAATAVGDGVRAAMDVAEHLNRQ